MDIWHSASNSSDYVYTGWVGRYLDAQCAGCDKPTQALEMDDVLSLAMKGEHIKGLAMKAGVALNPHTPIHLLENVINDIDVVLIMSVNPGFGGQHFIPQTLKKLSELREMIRASNAHALIEVDGGITLDNAAGIINAGANVLVAGSTVFSSADPAATIKALKES
jgi:ribulose-phosphate 3-epimerase